MFVNSSLIPHLGKQLKKAFIRVLDADVVPAAVFVYTGKRMSRQDLVQLKMEGELKDVRPLVLHSLH